MMRQLLVSTHLRLNSFHSNKAAQKKVAAQSVLKRRSQHSHAIGDAEDVSGNEQLFILHKRVEQLSQQQQRQRRRQDHGTGNTNTNLATWC
jgi:hypothetical protein